MLVAFLLVLTLIEATPLFGDIYNGDTFSKLNNARIRIEGPVSSQFIASSNYSIDLPPGNYTIIASYFKDGKLDLYTEEKLSISDRGIRFDLVLLPYALQALIPMDTESDSEVLSPKPSSFFPLSIEIIVTVLIIVILATAFYLWHQSKTKKQSHILATETKMEKEEIVQSKKDTLASQEPYYLDADSRKLLDILKTQGGRILQKELRDILKISESAMSLMLSELESVGYIKRFKRGRENLVKLVKEPEK